MGRSAARPPGGELLARQRAAAERLRRELFSTDGSLRFPYFRDLRNQFRDPAEPLDLEDLYARCALADIVYLGDFHANPACQLFAADLLAELARRVSRLSLGIEFIYTRQQELLAQRQAGVLDDDAFLRRVHYEEEWGYPWEGYRALLDRARELGVPVHALDRPPRGGFDGLAARDEHAARRIAALASADPTGRILVFFGESHLSRSHVPHRVRTRLARSGVEPRQASIFQDPDSVYWRLVAAGERVPRAVGLGDDTYAVLHTSPLAKYEAYRQVLERWRGEVPSEEEVDLTPAVHHILLVLLGWLGVRPHRRLRHATGWVEDLVDAFPEVYSGAEAARLLPAILSEHGRTPEEVRESWAVLEERGALYDARSNTMFVARYSPACAAGEGARFLRVALSGRLAVAAEPRHPDPAERAYGAVYDEALAGLGARLVDPGAAMGGPTDPDAPTTAARERWMAAHRRFEASAVAGPPEEVLEPLRRSRASRRMLAMDLGRRLGDLLFDLVREGRIGRAGIRRLFSRRLDPPMARRFIVGLLRGRLPA